MKTQTSDVFESLKRTGIIKRGHLQQSRLENMSFTSILDVLDEITNITSQIPNAEIAGKTHCASIGLSGAASECAAITCRMNRADELARFSALYSDHVFFHNFLADLSPSFGHPPDVDTDDVRLRLLDDFRVFSYLRPLIESGILIPHSTPRVYCLSCFAKSQIGNETSRRVTKAKRTLNQMLMNSMDVSLNYFNGETRADCTGNTPFFEHGSVHFFLDDDALVDRPRLFRKLRRNGSLQASKTLTRDLAFHEIIVEDTLYNAVYQMAVSELTGADLLSHRAIEVDVLQRIACDNSMSTMNSTIAKHWTNMVPFVGDVALRELVKLRSRERHSFVQYRSALDEAVAAVVGEREALSDRHARSVYSDILAPELGRLETKIAEAKRDLVKTPILSALGITATIGIGMYSGLMPSELIAIAKPLGLGKIIYDVIQSTLSMSDIEKEIRTERFYFLWKINHSTSSHRRH